MGAHSQAVGEGAVCPACMGSSTCMGHRCYKGKNRSLGHVDRELKRSQCLFSLLRLLRHRLLCSNFLSERLHLLFFSSCVPSVQ